MTPAVEMQTLGGRAAELEQISAWLEQTAAGSLQAVLVEGEAGIGKTSVVEAALAQARARGFRVLAGSSDEVERARPFGPFAEALGRKPDVPGPRPVELARLLTGDAREGGEPLELTRDPGVQFRVVDAIVDMVEELALSGPVALVLEDLHWADPSTLLALRSLSRRLTYLPIALLATLRPVPRMPELDRLVDALVHEGARRIVLGPLPADAVATLVAQLVDAEPGAALLKEVEGASGNPLFVIELVKALVDEGAIHRRDGRAELSEVSIPPSLRLTILRRLSFLDAEALELLQVASALGSTFSIRDVALVLDRPATGLLRPVQLAVRAGVLEERDERLGFRHDLIRDAVYADLPQDARAALHLEAGRRLAAAGAPALRVAEQFALGAQPGDAEAVDRLHAGARAAARRSPKVAVGLLERALQLVDDTDERRVRLLADLVPTLLWSGRPADAEARARDGLATSSASRLEGTLRLGLVGALAAQGRVQDVIDEARLALGDAAVAPDVRAQLQAEAANALAFMDELDAAEEAARKAVAPGTAGRSEGANLGRLVLCDTWRVRGRPFEALEQVEHVLKHAARRTGARLPWPAEVFLAMTLQQLDRFEEAHEALRKGHRADEELGNVSYLPVYDYETAALLFQAGRWDDAVAHAQTGLDLADEVGLEILRTWPNGILALIAVHRDNLDGASAAIASIEGRPGAETAGLARGLLAEARGDAAGALELLGCSWDRDTANGIVYRRRALGPDLVRLALAAGDHDRAKAVTAGVEEAAALAPVPSLEGAALRCRGLLERDADRLLRAVDAYRRGPRAFERAAACEDAALALAGAGRSAAAAMLFDEALSVYGEAGARRDAARALASMRELGIGRKRRGARKRPPHGWESLTPSELEVVRLAADGLTNPQIGQRLFISPRTVQTHLAHAFRKLDLSSRVELAAEAARRGGV